MLRCRRLFETRSGELNPVDTGTAPINESLALKGMEIYHNSSCAVCHGGLLSNSGSNAPDLRESAAILDLDTMKAILHDGVLLPNGMPQFKDLNDEEILAISEYARQVICDTKPRLRLANQ